LVDRFSDWLPTNIIDCHAHYCESQHLLHMDKVTYNHMISTFPFFTLEESLNLRKIFFPKKNIFSLRFPMIFRGMDYKKVNQDLLEKSPVNDRVAILGSQKDIEYTINIMNEKRASALKMYYSFVLPPAETIYQIFPKEVLTVAQEKGIPIILHLPKIINYCLVDLLKLLKDFPGLKVVLAHLGLSKVVLPGMKEACLKVASFKNVFLDTSLITSPERVKLAIDCFGYERIMYGSDEPLNLIRSKPYLNPENGQRLITEFLYHWVDTKEHKDYGYLAKDLVHAHWSSLLALREAIELCSNIDKNSIKKAIFFENAKKVYGF